MIAASARRDSSPDNYSSFWSLAISTVFAVAVVLVCRSLASFISHDAAELDGFIFVAALYWVTSLVVTSQQAVRFGEKLRSVRVALRRGLRH